jgi:hypothetical protein
MSGEDVQVRGPATAEEIAAVLAALRIREASERPASRYEQWRRDRLAALRDSH